MRSLEKIHDFGNKNHDFEKIQDFGKNLQQTSVPSSGIFV